MPIHTEPVDKQYVRIRDTFAGDEQVYRVGILVATTGNDEILANHGLIEMPDDRTEIHPMYAITEITKEEYFLGVLKG